MYIHPKQENNHKKQVFCLIFIYSMAFLHKLPHHYLRIPLKVQHKLVWNLVVSASRGIKLQLNIFFTWSLLINTEALQNYFQDWLLILVKKRNKLKIFSRIQIASQFKHTPKLFRLQYFVFWVRLTKEEVKPCSLSGQRTSSDRKEKVSRTVNVPVLPKAQGLVRLMMNTLL